MSQMPSGVHSSGTVLSPSTTRTMAFFIFALAVPKEFFVSTGTGVILRIIGKTYSSTLPSSHSTTPRVWVVMFVTLMSDPSSLENWSRTSCGSTRSPSHVFLAAAARGRLDRGADGHRFVGAHVVGDGHALAML